MLSRLCFRNLVPITGNARYLTSRVQSSAAWVQLSTYRKLLRILQKRCTVSYTDMENKTLTATGMNAINRAVHPPLEFVREKYRQAFGPDGSPEERARLQAWSDHYVALLSSTMEYEVELRSSGWGVPDRQPIEKFNEMDEDERRALDPVPRT